MIHCSIYTKLKRREFHFKSLFAIIDMDVMKEKVSSMDEFSLINKIKQTYYRQPSLIKGIGDDAAVFRETAGDMAVAVDTFVEGVHFTKETMDPFHVGYRGLAANLSDLAAMGAYPMYYLVSITIPEHWKEAGIAEIFDGMKTLANKYGTDLLGGDTVSGGNLVLSITVIGKTEKDKARYRSDAVADDLVFVTGTLGDSRAGLHILQYAVENTDKAYFINRHRMPAPRIEFTQLLRNVKRMSLNDISDGLASEAHEIAEASKVSIVLEDQAIPVHPSLKEFLPQNQYNWKYFGGEDFELAGTVARKDWPHLQAAAKKLNLNITEIGYVINKSEEPVYIKQENKWKPLEKAGYIHLK